MTLYDEGRDWVTLPELRLEIHVQALLTRAHALTNAETTLPEAIALAHVEAMARADREHQATIARLVEARVLATDRIQGANK